MLYLQAGDLSCIVYYAYWTAVCLYVHLWLYWFFYYKFLIYSQNTPKYCQNFCIYVNATNNIYVICCMDIKAKDWANFSSHSFFGKNLHLPRFIPLHKFPSFEAHDGSVFQHVSRIVKYVSLWVARTVHCSIGHWIKLREMKVQKWDYINIRSPTMKIICI